MTDKTEVLKLINEYSVQENSSSIDRIIEQKEFDQLAEEIVKLFFIPEVIKSVCVCENAEKEKYSQIPVYCHNCNAYVQTVL